ncbi:MAG: molybdopterin dinucleotide binding domain-containing protein, partial [Dehalococcoidia bacterium]
TAADVTAAIEANVAGYPSAAALAASPGGTRVVDTPSKAVRQPVAAAPALGEGIALITGRSLYHSWEGSTMRYEEADKLHREEAVWVHPQDAEALGVRTGDVVELTNGDATVRIEVRLEHGVNAGTVYVPHYFDGGAVMALFALEGRAAGIPAVRMLALQPA